MSRTIDERIVEMRFDNKQFEAGAKQTMTTLDRLKQALNLPDSGKAIDNLGKSAKNMDLSGIAAGVEALQKRFSTLGIVGMRVVENLTDSFMNFASRGVNFVTDSIISGGIKRAMNIENAHFQLQALLKDEEKVQAVMADAMESVDGTAYAYDEAAKAAAQFSASGIQAGDQMLGALKGITGVAAMTNSEFEGISQIFTTVAGNGRLMGDQLLQLSSRGLNAASTIADYFREVRGQAGMTEGAIREMVSKGQIDFNTFAEAMNWAFGDSAKRANETFTGALSNMKSALARIGAGFISPLVEQNGELIQLFNALRIKINDVKSALVFDEQKSAISGMTKEMSLSVDTVGKLTREGKIGFDTFTKSILESSKSTGDLEKTNTKLSELFESSKENGKVTLDTIKEFNAAGTEASNAVQKYMNGVLDGSIKASAGMKQTVHDITGGTKLISGDVAKLASEGKLSLEVFTNSMVWSSGAIKKEGSLVSDTLKGMFDEVKNNGGASLELLQEFRANGIDTYSALREYMNGVTNGSIRASYATKQAIEEMTGGTELVAGDVARLAKEGKISFDIFQSAMEHAFGDSKALSKQFTDSFLDMIKNVVQAVQNFDMTKPMEAFYHGVEAVKNVVKGLLSVLAPIGKAFKEVFPSFNGDGVISFAMAIEKLTSKMRLSEKSSKNLHDTFKGLFSVADLLVTIFVKLLSCIVPISKPVNSLGEGLLGLTGAIGRTLTSFTEFVRQSSTISKAYNLIKTSIQSVMSAIAKFISALAEVGEKLYNLPIVQKAISNLVSGFKNLGSTITSQIAPIIKKLDDLGDALLKMIPTDAEDIFKRIIEIFSKFKISVGEINLANPGKQFQQFGESIKKGFLDILSGNKGLETFVTNMMTYLGSLKESFTFDGIINQIKKFRGVFDGFVKWIKESVIPTLKLNLGGMLSAGGGLGMIYALIKATKSFESIGNSLKSITGALGSVKGVLNAYQKDLKADAILKIAKAITLLAVALTVLSFADLEKVAQAAVLLGVVGAALVKGLDIMSKAVYRGTEVSTALNTFARKFGSALKKVGTALEIKAIGAMVKDFGIAIAIIAASMLAITYGYSKDKASFEKAAEIVAIIAGALGIMIGATVLISDKYENAPKDFARIATGVLEIAAALAIIVLALNKLMKMEFPTDPTEFWQKVGTLGGIFAALTVLTLAVGKANKEAGEGKISTGPIIALAGMLYVTVLALDKLFKMELPEDWIIKIGILAGIFAALGLLTNAIAKANKEAGGALKATASILSMCLFVGVAVGALMILSIMPGEKLLKGAIALGLILVALGKSLAGAGKITNAQAYKSVLAMAVTVGSIVVALGVLSMIKTTELVKAAVALGSILLTLAADFSAVGRITNEKAWASIVAMCGAVAVIAGSLYVLAKQPWEGILAGGIALGSVLLVFTAAFAVIDKANRINLKKIGEFLLATLAVIPIGLALYELAQNPWEQLLAAGVALGTTILAFSAAFALISIAKPNLTAIAAFLAGCVGVIGIGLVLNELAQNPWEQLLAAGKSLSLVLIAMSGAMVLCAVAGSLAPGTLAGIALLDLFVVNLYLVLKKLGEMAQDPVVKELIGAGSGLLGQLGAALGNFVGQIIGNALSGVTSALPKMGEDLSDFADKATPFFQQMKNVNQGVLTGVKNLALAVLAITAADVIQGATRWFTGGSSMVKFGEELEKFGPHFKAFASSISGIDGAAVQASANAAMAMAEMAKKLPNSGGLAAKIFGDNSLAEFGAELRKFGPHLAAYAKSVAGIDAASVEASASAAQVLGDMAKKLPNNGGLSGKIFGENNISAFGAELRKFGPHLAAYAKSVEGVDGGVVQASANAAQVLADFATKLPNQGGLKAFFSGDNKLSVFGAELEQFGVHFKGYYDQISGIDAGNLNGIIEAVKNLVDLAAYSSGADMQGMQNLAFTLQNIGEMGVKNFIAAFTNAGPAVQTAVMTMINYVTTTMNLGNALISAAALTVGIALTAALANGVQSTQGSVVSSVQNLTSTMIATTQATLPASSFNSIAQTAVQGLVTGINNMRGLVLSTVKNLCTALIQQFKTSLPATTFNQIGQSIIQALINGINAKRNLLLTTTKNLCTALIQQFKTSLPASTFNQIGQSIIQALVNGMNAKRSLAISTATEICTAVMNAFKQTLQPSVTQSLGQQLVQALANGIASGQGAVESAARSVGNAATSAVKSAMNPDVWRQIGRDAGAGLANGIESKISAIGDAAARAAAQAVSSARQALDEHSPSKEMFEVGAYAGLGMVNGLSYYMSRIKNAGTTMAENTVGTVREIIEEILDFINSEDFDMSPVVTPILDLSNIQKGAREVSSLFNKRFSISPIQEQVYSAASTFDYRKKLLKDQNEEASASSKDNRTIELNYEQNIYSPKALNRAEIYRDSKSMFAAGRKIVEDNV